jgi:hypothetical protein
MRWHWLLALILLFAFAGATFGQNPDGQNSEQSGTPSLGEAAKKNKEASKSKAKRVITDEDLLDRSPIPVIATTGLDNTDDILNAIHEFRRTHDASETERVVHDWFDGQTEALSAAIDANSRLAQHYQQRMEVNQDESAYGYQYDPDSYSKMQQKQITDRRAQRVDARNNRDNWQVIMRIQQTFVKVRADMFMAHAMAQTRMAYDWFKIRNANGLGSY